MKKPLRLFAALLAFCVAAAAIPLPGLAAEGTVHDIQSGTDLYDFLQEDIVKDGDILRCADGVRAPDNPSIDDPWIIDKRVTIEGGSLSIGTGGILLGADVTFKDTQLTFTKPICNAIVANGYALTLDGVTASGSGYVFNVFCGTLVKNSSQTFEVPPSGSSNTVIIRGSTNLRSGNMNVVGESNIYAGSLSLGSMDPGADEAGAPSAFAGDPVIRIEGCANSAAPLGTIYAGGAQQRNTFGVQAEKYTTRDPGSYTVSGTVAIEGANDLPAVDGAGAGAVNVVYRGNGNQAVKTFQTISGLSVESGYLVLAENSSFGTGGMLSLGSGAKLDLSRFPDPIPVFQGSGGILILGPDQTLRFDQADGTAKVAIGGTTFDNAGSSSPAAEGKTYLQTPGSSAAEFQLLPYSTQPNMTLEKNSGGGWTAVRPAGEVSKLKSLGPEDTQADSGDTEVIIPLNPICTGEELSLNTLSPAIQVNGQSAAFTEDPDPDYSYYEAAGLRILTGNYDGEALAVYHADGSFSTPISDGIYRIEITVPGRHTESGSPITAAFTLTVGGSAPGSKTIPVPTANTGLRWTGEEQTGVNEGEGYTLSGTWKAAGVGSYTASAALDPNCQWADGSTTGKTIPWSIAKAIGPAAPAGLTGVPPAAAGGFDGKITGTTAEMEYAVKADFTGAQTCGDPETAGLSSGTYYVRVKETPTHEAGAAGSITVPVPGAPTVTEISISSTAHKTEYHVGDPLDVTDLTIEVSYSDSTKRTIPVTEDMVSGFDSSRAAESQTLTVLYEGKNAVYSIRITAGQQPGGPARQVTVRNTGEGGTAEGVYEYEEGADVTVRAGVKNGLAFAAWDAAGVTLVNRNVPDVSFKMPANDVTLSVIWRPDGGTPPSGHRHTWDPAWKNSGTHHWHDCAASGCPISDNSQKSGYGPHTAGDWVVDRPASSSQGGVRHRSCTVCGYEMARETIPAAGGGSSSSGGGSSEGGPSSGDAFSGGGSSPVKNPDGSTTSTSTNKATGTVTETTRRPDGSKTVVETRKDGTVTTTGTAADGSTFKTVARPNGVTETTIRQSDGLTASIRENSYSAKASIRIPAKLAEENPRAAVILPIPALSGENASVTVRTGTGRPVAVEIPIHGNDAVTVACLVNGDGTETILKTAVLSGGQITVSVPDGATVLIRNNGKNFQDIRSHWARSDIDFVTARELFSGKSSDTFAPDAPLSRAMLMTVLARLDGADTTGGSAYQKGIAWAVARGISDGRNPDGQVTREQLAAMLYRCAGSPAATERELGFSDAEAVSGYAWEAVRWAKENGILSGYADGSLAPKGRTTRAQAAAILARYVRFLNQR